MWVFFSVADLCCCSPTWDLRREHSESVMLPSLITRCCLSFLKNLSFHAARLTVLRVSPSVSVFCVGGLWPRLQQQHYSDWSSTVQRSTGPVQPPSHGSSSLHLCCASNRSVLLYSTAAAASTVLWIFHSNCLVDTPGSQFPFCVFFCTVLYQVTLQELCGLELRKEGSASWINMSPQLVLCQNLSLTNLLFLLFPNHLLLAVYFCTQLQLAKKTVCSPFPSLKAFIHSRKLLWFVNSSPFMSVLMWNFSSSLVDSFPQIFSGSSHSWLSWWDTGIFQTQFRWRYLS